MATLEKATLDKATLEKATVENGEEVARRELVVLTRPDPRRRVRLLAHLVVQLLCRCVAAAGVARRRDRDEVLILAVLGLQPKMRRGTDLAS